jgi:hypothetical protein
MAMMVATPDNLNDFAEKLSEKINKLGGGSSDFVSIDSYYTRFADGLDEARHSYIVVDKDFDISTIALQFGRRKRTNVRNDERTKFNEEERHDGHTTGWHQVWRLPISNKEPLVKPILKSTTPEFIKGSKAYYEFTVDGYETFFDFATDDDFETGYMYGDGGMVTIKKILKSPCGICFIKDGKQISNHAPVRISYDDVDGEIINLGIGK